MYFPKPRGRPPNNSWWDTSCGRWVKHGAQVQPRVVLATPVATANPPDMDKEREKRLQEEKELAEKNMAEMKELSRKYEEEQRAAKAAEEKAAYERLLAAPRHHAEWVAKQVPSHVPVYYLDHSGIQQQVGVEPRVPKRPCSDLFDAYLTRKRVIVQRIVHGPSAKYDLEEGESELVDVAVWRYSY
jgi:hypothetical protein